MQRVEADGDWSLFDPKAVPDLPDLYGDAFEAAYAEAEARGLAVQDDKARDLYARMMRTLAQTGNGWMTFKDKSQPRLQPDGDAGHTSSTSPTSAPRSSRSRRRRDGGLQPRLDQPGAPHVVGRRTARVTFDFDKLARTVRDRRAPARPRHRPQLLPDRSAQASNLRWRPVGLGLMGLQDVFFQLRLPFDAPEARAALAAHLRGGLLPRAVGLVRAGGGEGTPPGLRRDAGGAGRAAVRRLGRRARRDRGALGRPAGADQARTACATRCSSPLRRRRPSPRSPAATSASSRRSPTSSSARRSRATSSRSTATWSPS